MKLAGVLLAIGMLPLGAWAGKGAERMEKDDKALALSARTVRLDDKSLVFEYTFTNNSEGPVYVFSVLFQPDETGKPIIDRNTVYSFLRKGGVVEFCKTLLRVPPWAVVEAPEVPFLVRVGKGETHREEVGVPLPLRVHDPYEDNYPNGYKPAAQTAVGWKFSLGVVTDDPKQPVVRTVTVGGKSLLTIGYEDGFKRQVVVSSEVVPDKLPVLAPALRREKEMLKASKP
jgi:hypothetical protein